MVGQYDIQDLPTALRQAMGPDAGHRTETRMPAAAPEAQMQSDDEVRVATRRAFDLDVRDQPLRRTGVGEIRVSDLILLREED